MKVSIKVGLERKIGVIDPKIYGQFMCRRLGVTDGGKLSFFFFHQTEKHF